MSTIIKSPAVVKAAGNKPKIIEEFIGNVSSKTPAISIARMKSPECWSEPGQTPESYEHTIVLHGMLRAATRTEVFEISASQAIIAHHGEWIQYSTPKPEGAEYISVCLPVFSPQNVHRDSE